MAKPRLYFNENGRRARCGTGPLGKTSKAGGRASSADERAAYDAQVEELLQNKDYAGAAALQEKHRQRLQAWEAAGVGDPAATEAPFDSIESMSSEEEEEEHEQTEEESSSHDVEPQEARVLKMLYKGNMAEVSRQEEQTKKAKVFNQKHSFYRHTRCTCVAQEEQSALPAGVVNTYEDSDDEDAYAGEQKEIAKEMDQLRVVQHLINQKGWDAAAEGRAVSPKTSREINLRLDWGEVKRKLADGAGGEGTTAGFQDSGATAAGCGEAARQIQDFPLERLDPTQRAFADRVLKWAKELVLTYKQILDDGVHRPLPLLRTWLAGSAGAGKSATLKTCVHHLRHLFQQEQVNAKVRLTAYTGVAAFNIGFGAQTACSAFQVYPKAAWKSELVGPAFKRLEATWGNVVLLIVDEVSCIGRAFFARMHFRMQQGRRRYFSEAAVDPNDHEFGCISVILVGDFGQLEPIEDWSMCDTEARWQDCPRSLRHLWKHAEYGKLLVNTFEEAVILKRIHRSKEDLWWTESCLRIRDFTCTKEGDYDWWRQHDLDRGHLTEQQKEYFDTMAVWLCARCEDVGHRNGQKLADMAEKHKNIVHQIKAHHSTNSKSARNLVSSVFDGLRGVINLVRGCKVMITRNVAYLYGLANGTRGTFVGAVYGPGGIGTFPEALILEIPEYCGPAHYPDEPKWVPILPITAFKEGTKLSRTQFPVVAGFALTVNKAQGLTIKEGVVLHLVGSKRFRPASKHGLPFVAFTRSESFAMTAFKNLPPWEDFVRGRDSDMLRMRLKFTKWLEKLHTKTLARHTAMTTPDLEQEAHDQWQAHAAKRCRSQGPPMPCPCCDAAWHPDR